jgi:hypothetical protein
METRVRPTPERPGPALLFGAALLSAGPAAIHFAVAYSSRPLLALAAPVGASAVLAAAAGTAGIVGLYLVSRTFGRRAVDDPRVQAAQTPRWTSASLVRRGRCRPGWT